MKLHWHPYTYYPYEKVLAAREVEVLFRGAVNTLADPIAIEGSDAASAKRLVYFAGFEDGSSHEMTTQGQLETAARSGKNRQATRYSVHGLHEYKGKFNPQVAKALLNIFGVQPGDHVLDPFCGSGTTLVEAAQLGANAVGTDVNPLAVYIANAKMLALGTPVERLTDALDDASARARRAKLSTSRSTGEAAAYPRAEYLRQWFEPHVLEEIETLRGAIEQAAGDLAPVLLTVASDLLRDYSQQDPKDLRIRRRTSPIPAEPFLTSWEREARRRLERLAASQAVIGHDLSVGIAQLRPAAMLSPAADLPRFDAAITSPPYAMALPYIDTQRLSLVWLGLLPPERILPLEAELIGSRETRGGERSGLRERMVVNASGLQAEEAELCLSMQASLSSADGFRRQAVPGLLYRYFTGMSDALRAVRSVMAPSAPFALIVGHNHTTLGGKRYEIDTPRHLANLASSQGWSIEELLPLQTYRRYGYHVSNAVNAETLVLLRC